MAMGPVADYGAEKWNNLVHRGREIVDTQGATQFAVGDIALEIAPQPPPGKRLPAATYNLLGIYAEEVGLERERLEEYRLVSAAWPEERRNRDVCWTVHSILSHKPNRFELIQNPPIYPRTGERRWTCDGARRALGWKTDVPESLEETVRHVQDLMKDEEVAVQVVERTMQRPEVVRQVAEKPHVRETFNRAQASGIREAHEDTKKRPEVRKLDEQQDVLTVLGLCSAFTSGIGRTLPRLHVANLSDEAKDSIREGLDRVRAAVDWTQHALETGSTDMDTAYMRLLREEL